MLAQNTHPRPFPFTHPPPFQSITAAASRDTVIPEPSYRIPAVWLGLNAATAAVQVLAGATPASQLPGFLLASILPLFLASRASAVKFVFGPDALEVVTAAAGKDTENAFVGGQNKWPYASFVNWEFFPSPAVPILVYFKETQTKPEGQIHFFPVLFDAKTLLGVMRERCGRSVNSGA
jgi:Protein of unknown function (DUF3119)